MSWGPIDAKYLTPVDMRCNDCGAVYVIHTFGYRIGAMVLSINEGCECGGCYGEVIGPTRTDEWPEFIDA